VPDRTKDLPDNARDVERKKAREDRRTRYEQYGEGHPYCHLPPVKGFEHLVNWWAEVGTALQGANGLIPITWSEVAHYAETNQLTAWERQTIIKMSRSYCRWLAKGASQGKVADDVPYILDDEETRAAHQSKMIEARDRSREQVKNG
jgi:hypothetical protein